MRNLGKPGSTPERESKMRLLKTHSNTSEGPGYEATKREEKYGTAGNADLPSHLPKPDTEHDRSGICPLTYTTQRWKLRPDYVLGIFCFVKNL